MADILAGIWAIALMEILTEKLPLIIRVESFFLSLKRSMQLDNCVNTQSDLLPQNSLSFGVVH